MTEALISLEGAGLLILCAAMVSAGGTVGYFFGARWHRDFISELEAAYRGDADPQARPFADADDYAIKSWE